MRANGAAGAGPRRLTGFVEVFSGSGRLAQAVSNLGVPAAALDIEKGFDILKPENEKWLLAAIRRRQIRCLWFGLPCTSWSRARHCDGRGPGPLRDDGDGIMGLSGLGEKDAAKVLDGNRLLWVTIRLCKAAAAAGIPWIIENPRTSRVWLAPAMKKLMRVRFSSSLAPPSFVHLDFCQFGEAWKKGTSLLTLGCNLEALGRRCCMRNKLCSRTNKRHIVLQGCDSSGQWLTRRAQPYPLQLCAEAASLIAGLCSTQSGKGGA